MSAPDATPRVLLGVVAKEPVYAPELRPRSSIVDSMICARCDGPMVISHDAIGRERRRCPKCDGVSKIRPHPDEALIPQGLVRANQLPPVAPGQLRCQRCARGVEGHLRFCAECSQRGHGERTYQPKRCTKCGAEFQPSGPRALYCEGCR